MMLSVKHLERKSGSSGKKKSLLEETSEEPVRTYSEQNMVVGRNVRMLVRNVGTRFVLFRICLKPSIAKQCLRKISNPA